RAPTTPRRGLGCRRSVGVGLRLVALGLDRVDDRPVVAGRGRGRGRGLLPPPAAATTAAALLGRRGGTGFTALARARLRGGLRRPGVGGGRGLRRLGLPGGGRLAASLGLAGPLPRAGRTVP